MDQGNVTGFKLVGNLHVSLFRGHFKLRVHQVQSFINGLTSRLSKLPKFKLILNRVNVLRNDENTRSFICVNIDPCFKYPFLDRLINEIENCLHEFEVDLKKYQDTFITHSSLIWCPGDIFQSKEEEEVKTLVDTLKKEFEEDPLKLEVSCISVKSGSQTFLVHLKS